MRERREEGSGGIRVPLPVSSDPHEGPQSTPSLQQQSCNYGGTVVMPFETHFRFRVLPTSISDAPKENVFSGPGGQNNLISVGTASKARFPGASQGPAYKQAFLKIIVSGLLILFCSQLYLSSTLFFFSSTF